MSLFSALTASVSGMAAQANSLSTISDNIANSDTTGYKEASTQFEDMLNEFSPSEYSAGGVSTIVNYGIADQGDLTATSSSTDMAIQGNGFFVVQDSGGDTYLTRAGSFTQNAQGTLVNASGYTLMGYPVSSTSPAPTSDTVSQLVPVTVSTSGLSANPTTSGTLTGNLPSDATAETTASSLPSANPTSGVTYTDMTSVTAYDNLGNPVTLNVYMTNTGPNTWQASVFNAADAAPGGGFPYSAGGLMSSATLNFSPTTGALTSTTSIGTPPVATTPANTLSVAIPNGQTFNLNLSGMTQLAASFSATPTVNGNAPASFQSLSVSTSGILSEVYSNGTTTPIFEIPLATVPSVNSMTSSAGDVFSPNAQSGNIVLGAANTDGFGSINGSELESSTVDLATELTNMVVTQNAYQANSKAFQVGSDMLSELVNLLK